MDEERQPKDTKDEPAPEGEPETGKTFEISQRSVGIGAITAVVALALGLGGYLVGKNGGEDLDQARVDGTATGDKIGTVKGSTAGYAVGLKQGKQTGYENNFGPAFKKAYADAVENAGLERPSMRSIQPLGE